MTVHDAARRYGIASRPLGVHSFPGMITKLGTGVPRDIRRAVEGDAMLMGRRTYEAFAEVWPPQTTDLADRVNSIRKYVFSSTLEKADWNNSTIMRGDVAAQVTELKHQDGRDLVIYGHGLLGPATWSPCPTARPR